ncbi:methyltransferase small domain protein [Gemella bergeri ATCC 700627]|uniref:Methyltransferase small domain protein n=2 Tax=Gemella bergeri TaxID=84136 RepID=U2S1Z7_9BACL|nr:methyltransferase small domain protein [Gemella bergeri ATCC 700627]
MIITKIVYLKCFTLRYAIFLIGGVFIMGHYYTNNPTTNSCEKIIYSEINNTKLKFYTDNGVFSKDNVDFGTRSLLESFSSEKLNVKVADIGCGYGVISIYLAKINPTYTFTMIDVNNRSLELAKKNIELNKVINEIEVIESSSFDNVKGMFDIVITNPPIRAGKQIVHKIMKDSYNHLVIAGELWVVIQKKQGMASCKKLLEGLFSNVEIISKNKGYYILKAVK